MYPSKEQLESKWWHRLIKVLRWVLTISVFIFLMIASLNDYDLCNRYGWEGSCNVTLLLQLFTTGILALITYFVFWLIYKKIILYIIFGKK